MYIKDKHYSTNIERAILGQCLLEKMAFGRVYGVLKADSFYHKPHQQVFEVMNFMYENSLPIDILTVSNRLIRVKGLDIMNNEKTVYFVATLTNDVVSTAHLEYHTHLLNEMFIERKLMHLTSAGIKKDGTVRDQIFKLQAELQGLNSGKKEDWEDMTSLMVKLYQHQTEMQESGGMGITTGLNSLDKENGGFHPGQMIVIGARPSVGKSAFIGQMAIDMAMKGVRVGIISLEMSNTEIAARLVAIDADLDFNAIYRGLYRDESDKQKLYDRISKNTSQLPIFVSDRTDVNVNEIKAKAHKLKALHGLDCLMIDYLQLVDAPIVNGRNRENEVSQISRATKIMAKDMGIPVIILCQLNREVTKRKGNDRYPQLSDLRESGSIEQDADVVMFLHRDSMNGMEFNEQGQSTEFEADLVVRKWRNGKANVIVPLDFDPPKMKFTERGRNNWVKVQLPSNVKNYTEPNEDAPF